MALADTDLLTLQGNIKKDPHGYKDEFLLQYRHYMALLDIFRLSPSHDSRELGELVFFVAQTAKCYPDVTGAFAGGLMALLEGQAGVLDPPLRRTLVQGLIMLRNRGQVEALQLLPLFFKLFACQDKTLRIMLFKHIVTDIKNSNRKHRQEKLNRRLQSFLYGVLADDNEAAAKKSLAVLTELWRRNVWQDARTVNVIASAAFHKSSRVMLAVMKFFLGQDEKEEEGDASEDEAEKAASRGPNKEDVYKAYKKGTHSSKKKKVAKLKRVMGTLRKQARKGADTTSEVFAAIHLLHDPQSFSERLYARLANSHERYETRLAMMSVLSRVVGTHKVVLLQMYPLLQRYIQPHQRDVTTVLAALAQATHDLVPPDVLAPVMRQLVDQFVHDRARPEVMTVGLKAVRELCLRCPLVMSPELLQDLTEYKKFRTKQVSNAARSLISLFREIAPGMLAKRDQGRGADKALELRQFGEIDVAQRVAGAELLEQELARGEGDRSDEDEDEDGSDLEEIGAEEDAEMDEIEGEEGEEGSDDDEDSEVLDDSEEEEEEAGSSSEMEDEGEEGDEEEEMERKGERQRTGITASTTKGQGGEVAVKKLQPKDDSLAQLRQRLKEANERRRAEAGEKLGEEGDEKAMPLEAEVLLTDEDFARIKELRTRQAVHAALARHGLKPTDTSRRATRIAEAAQEEAEEALALAAARQHASEMKVAPATLDAQLKRRRDKEERIASIMEGREGRGKFGGSTGRKKLKSGGLSNKEKQKSRNLPIAARMQSMKNRRIAGTGKKNPKNFKGHQ